MQFDRKTVTRQGRTFEVIEQTRRSRSTTVLDAIDIHGRTLGAVARERGIGINRAVEILIEDARAQREAAREAAFTAGQRSVLPGNRWAA